jgi:hypothetical protein
MTGEMGALGIAAVCVAAAFAAGPPARAASRLDGAWEIRYPLAPDQKCPTCTDDLFSLELWSSGDRLCGVHLASAHAGHKVDEVEDYTPSIAGRLSGGEAEVTFASSWGGRGEARLKLTGGKLQWDVTRQSGQSWIPDHAILSRKPVRRELPAVCAAPAPEPRGG